MSIRGYIEQLKRNDKIIKRGKKIKIKNNVKIMIEEEENLKYCHNCHLFIPKECFEEEFHENCKECCKELSK